MQTLKLPLGQNNIYFTNLKYVTPISHNKLKWFLNDMELNEFGIEDLPKVNLEFFSPSYFVSIKGRLNNE